MNILLLGKGGQVGWELQRSLAPLGTLVALGASSTDYAADFSQPDAVAATVRALRPRKTKCRCAICCATAAAMPSWKRRFAMPS